MLNYSFLIYLSQKKLKSYDVSWINKLDNIKTAPTLFIGNEFFDALPIKQFIKKNNEWYEKYVKFSKLNQPEFVDILVDIKKIEKKIGLKISHRQKFIEYSPLTIEYLKIISNKIYMEERKLLFLFGEKYNKKEFHQSKLLILLDLELQLMI